jgi:hypothetical protein
MLQNLAGTNAATWQQKLAADFPPLEYTTGKKSLAWFSKGVNYKWKNVCGIGSFSARSTPTFWHKKTKKKKLTKKLEY